MSWLKLGASLIASGSSKIKQWLLFVPSGSDSFITTDGDTFKVRG